MSDFFEILIRLGGRVIGFAICCFLLYQAWQAGRSALLGKNADIAAPGRNPGSASSRFAAALWSATTLIMAAIGFGAVFGLDVLGTLLRLFSLAS
ncbi:hypothetical protein RAD16_19280 [Bradyrhizobium sp. 18BD]